MTLLILFAINAVLLIVLLLYFAHVAFFEKNNLQKQLAAQIAKHEAKQKKLRQKIYHAEVLRELSERIGYSLDIPKIIEVITGSLGEVLDYHTASYLIQNDDHLEFHCFVSQPVNHRFIKTIKRQMIKAYAAMLNAELSSKYVEEAVSGTILDDTLDTEVASFFNLPLVISGKIVGLINIASPKNNLYTEEETRILYIITGQAAEHYSKLQNILQQEKRKLNAMVSSMADGVIMLDQEMQLIVFNPAAKQMLQLSAVANPTILDLANNLAGKVDLRTKLDEAVNKDQVVEQKDIFLNNKALHLLISPVKDSNNELLGSAILFRDITAEKELEQMREEFTAMMVHELRAPLTTIKGTTDMIINEARLPLKTKNKLLTSMKAEAEHMLDLVGDLLDVAKIEAGKFQIEPLNNNLVQTLCNTVDKFRPQAQQKGLTINTVIPKTLPKLSFDQLRINQVLNNLLSNAIKYTEQGFIQITAKKDKQFVTVSIGDTGAGMSATEVAGLFSKFKQFGKGKSGEIKGTGLGLVIAKGIIEAHGGKIWAQSEGHGKGSIFSFSLPLKQTKEGGGSKK